MSVPPVMEPRFIDGGKAEYTYSKVEGASGEPVEYIAFRELRSRLCGSCMEKMRFCSRIERYLADVPKWVILRSWIIRGMLRSPWGWKGEPSYKTIVQPAERAEVSQCHIIHVVVVK